MKYMIMFKRTFGILFLCHFFIVLPAQEQLNEHYFTGDYQYVIESASQQIQSGDTSLNTFYLKALSEAQIGQSPEAINTLEQALDLYPDDSRLTRMLAGQYFDAGDYVKANQSYKELVSRDSTDVSAWMKLAPRKKCTSASILSFTTAY